MKRTEVLRGELIAELKEKEIFKKDWFLNLSDEQEEVYTELFDEYYGYEHPVILKIIAYREGCFIGLDDFGEEYLLDPRYDVRLETIEDFIERKAV